MGMRLFGSSSASRTSAKRSASGSGALLPGDPNPERFEILRVQQLGEFAAEIRWPDASNYEGRKLAVYRATAEELRAATRLDPHFQERRGALVPIARFEPTAKGWTLAIG